MAGIGGRTEKGKVILLHFNQNAHAPSNFQTVKFQLKSTYNL